MNTDSTVLISKYLKEYNHIYKEANDIYHEIARKLQLSDSALDIFYTIFEIGDNCPRQSAGGRCQRCPWPH